MEMVSPQFVCLFEMAAQLLSSAIVPGLFTSHKSFLHPIGDWDFFYIYLDHSTRYCQSRVDPSEDLGNQEKGLKEFRVNSERSKILDRVYSCRVSR